MSRTDRTISSIQADTIVSSPPGQLSHLLAVLQAVECGDFRVRLPGVWTGLEGKIADTVNAIVSSNARMADELERVGTVVGKQGKTPPGTHDLPSA